MIYFNFLKGTLWIISQGEKILLCGDFNSRTGVLSDVIAGDFTEYLPQNDDCLPDRPVLTKYSRDVVIDNNYTELHCKCNFIFHLIF